MMAHTHTAEPPRQRNWLADLVASLRTQQASEQVIAVTKILARQVDPEHLDSHGDCAHVDSAMGAYHLSAHADVAHLDSHWDCW
jgi:hypothetical protein